MTAKRWTAEQERKWLLRENWNSDEYLPLHRAQSRYKKYLRHTDWLVAMGFLSRDPLRPQLMRITECGKAFRGDRL